MVSAIICRWLGIDDIKAALKDVPSVAMLRVEESNQKQRHKELLTAIREQNLTRLVEYPKIEAKPSVRRRVNWSQARAALEARNLPEEQP